MNPIVEEYLQKNADRVEQVAQEKEKAYRERVAKAAGLLQDGWVEVSRSVFSQSFANTKTEKDEYGEKHYFIEDKVPMDLSDEEFAEVCKTFTAEELEKLKIDRVAEKKEIEQDSSSGASTFFNVLGWILLIAGFIIAIAGANVEVIKSSGYRTYTEKEFSFTVFITAFLVYIIYACFCFCAATLFKELRTITNLLRRKK